MKIAITGANGFVGSNVVKELKKQDVSLRLLDRKKHNLLQPSSLQPFTKGSDVVIHLAGVNRGKNMNIVRVNTLGTLSLLEAMSKYTPNAKIIFASSFQVYLQESLYGLSKKAAEELIKQFAAKKLVKGSVFRISNVYGPNGKPFYNSVIATFAYLAKKGELLNINGDGSQKRDFIYIDDLVNAIVKAALQKQEKSFEIYNICSGKETSLNTIINTMRKVYRKKINVVYNKAVKEKSWPTSGRTFQKAKALLDWSPKTSITAGLRKVMNA